MHFVYFLRSNTGRYYIGVTNDVHRRLQQHNAGSNRSTKAHRPWGVVRIEQCATLSAARKREYSIKAKKSKRIIEKHILGR